MPWWIWLILALFMLAMIVIGCVYAIRHGIQAMHVMSGTASQIGDRVARMGEPVEETEPEAPFFTQPLKVTLDRYETTRTRKAEREIAKRTRHMEVWERWDREPIKTPDFISETDD
ncbi:hypothetical protein KIH75_01425 [Bifidobacterium sp. 64T4]|uniref:hypothetical protein n=1 Tax=Bifidobacterium pongonis TaxID=2834432 RepID=UPI001C5682CA|nr:hypothetical protein [Bifidobacterium pongonis]MBW3094032.1 hypothetical protein [Bifidobacterium pongonis]